MGLCTLLVPLDTCVHTTFQQALRAVLMPRQLGLYAEVVVTGVFAGSRSALRIDALRHLAIRSVSLYHVRLGIFLSLS